MQPAARPVRGLLLDCARLMERPAYYEKAFGFLTARGVTHVVWHFTDDQGSQMQFRSVPGIGSPHALSVAQTQRLVAVARGCGLTLVPELAALGHSRYITRLPQYAHLNEDDTEYTGMCPVAPETRQVLGLLLRETMDVFDGPAVHVGLDEVEIGHHPLTRAALRQRPRAQVMAEHIRFLHDLVVTQGGREMWMWGDGLLKSPETAAAIPKDIVVCDWHYHPDATDASTRQLLAAGFDVITASALLSHGQPLLPSTGYALENVRRMRRHRETCRPATAAAGPTVRGEIVTTWMHQRTLADAQWLGWHVAAAVLEAGPDADAVADIGAAVAAFGRDFYGLGDVAAWSAAARAVLDDAPQRAEWLAVLKLDFAALPAASADTLADAAERWAGTADALDALADQVRRERTAFDAFRLVVHLLAHAYDAASCLHEARAGDDSAAEQMPRLLRRREALRAAFSDAWDRERYADDVAKTRPVIRFFRDDHLLLVLNDGLAVLQDAVRERPIAADIAPVTNAG